MWTKLVEVDSIYRRQQSTLIEQFRVVEISAGQKGVTVVLSCRNIAYVVVFPTCLS